MLSHHQTTCAEVIEGGDSSDKLAAEAWAGAVDVLQGGHWTWNHTAVVVYQHLSQSHAENTMGSLQDTHKVYYTMMHKNMSACE